MVQVDLRDIDISDSREGAVQLTIDDVILSRFETDGDVDYFSFDVQEPGTYEFVFDPNGVFSTQNAVFFNANGDEIESGAASAYNAPSSYYVTTSQTGQHFVALYSNYSFNDYTFGFKRSDDIPGSPDTEATLSVGGTVAVDIDYRLDADWYAVDLEAGQSYLISSSLQGENVEQPEFSIIDADLQVQKEGAEALLFTPSASGTYYVSATQFQTGTFDLTVRTSNDLPADTSTQERITLGTPKPITLETRQDEDWLRVGLEEGEYYVFETTGNISFDVYRPDVNPLTSTDGFPIRLLAFDTTDYFVGVSGGNRIGDFELLVHEPDDIPNSPGTTATLELGVTRTEAFEFRYDQDYFKLEVEAGQTYLVATSSPMHYDIDGLEFAEVPSGYSDRFAFTAVNNGTYYVSLEENGQREYDVVVTEINDVPGDVSTTVSITPGQPQAGEFEVSSDQDWYRVELEAGQSYAVGTSNGYAAVIDENGTILRSETFVYEYTPETSGVYYIGAVESLSIDAYEISISAFDDIADDTTTDAVLVLGETISGAIDISEDSDWFRVDLAPGQTYEFNAPGTSLRIRDEFGGILGGGEGQLFFTEGDPFSSAEYYLSVESFNPKTYDLSYTLLNEVEGNAFTGETLEVGETVAVKIDFSGDEDWYRVELDAGQRYVLSASDFVGLGAYDDNGVALFSKSLFGLQNAVTFTPTTSGTHYVAGKSSSPKEFDMTLSRFDDVPGDASTDAVMPFGETVTVISDFSGDSDWYRFAATEGNVYSLDTPSDVTVRFHAHSNSDSSEFVGDRFIAPSADEYFVEIVNFNTPDLDNNKPTVDVVLTEIADVAGDATTSATLEVDGAIEGTIAYQVDTDWIRVDLEPGRIYTAEATGNVSFGFTTETSPFSSGPTSFSPDPGETYFLAVTSTTIGDYSVNLREEPDVPGDTSTQNTLELGVETVSALVSGEDSDWYRVDLEAGENYTVTISGFQNLALRDATGNLIKQAAQGLSHVAQYDGVHFVSVEDENLETPMQYALRIERSDDLPADASTPLTISPDETVSVSGRIDFTGDIDWIRLDVDAGRSYQIIDESLPNLEIVDKDGNLLYMSFSFQNLRFDGDEGTEVYLRVGSDIISDYSFTFREIADIPDDNSTQETVTIGTTTSVSSEFSGDEDWYRVTLEAGQSYLAQADDADIAFYGPDGEEIGFDNRTLEFTVPEDGDYFIGVSVWEAFTSSSLTISEVFEVPGNNASTENLAVGETISVEIGFEGDRDWYRVSVREGQSYKLTTETGVFTEFEQFEPVGFVTDTNVGPVFFAQTDGEIFASFFGFEEGSYTASLEEFFDVPDGYETPFRLTLDETLTGRIDFQSDHDSYKVALNEGEDYLLSIVGAQRASVQAPGGTFLPVPNGTTSYTFTAGESGDWLIMYRGLQEEDYSLTIEALTELPPDPTAPEPTSTQDYENLFVGDEGDNPIVGTPDADWIVGGVGRDDIQGLDGDDYIAAGAGNDWHVRGGAGADIYQFGFGDNDIVITDWQAGIDKIRLMDGLNLDDLSVTQATFGGLARTYLSTSHGDRLILVNQTAAALSVDDFVSFESGSGLQLSDYDSLFVGDDLNNPLIGTDQADWIVGGAGRDDIQARDGDDYIAAGSGNDWHVRGGTGADIYQFGPGDNDIAVTDWQAGIDKIHLSDGLALDDLTVIEATFGGVTRTTLSTEQGDRLILINQQAADISQDDFI